MIVAIVRMPYKKDGKKKLGKAQTLTFKNRAELAEYMDGVMQGAYVKLLKPEAPSCRVQNIPMQRACGVTG